MSIDFESQWSDDHCRCKLQEECSYWTRKVNPQKIIIQYTHKLCINDNPINSENPGFFISSMIVGVILF